MMKKDGFAYTFHESACSSCGGRCCTGESGNIFISMGEQEALANHLNLSVELFRQQWCRKVGVRYSLQERVVNGSHDCIMFDRTRLCCSVYEFRPKQCRTFPFWDYFIKYPAELQKECPGVIFDA